MYKIQVNSTRFSVCSSIAFLGLLNSDARDYVLIVLKLLANASFLMYRYVASLSPAL
jgi:hypothetical protein